MADPTATSKPPVSGVLVSAAGLTLFIVIARAWLQSATIDECDAYLTFSSLPWPSHWYASSGNHVLNSIVVRCFTSIFGLSHLTLRSGAVAGALIFVVSACRLALIFGSTTWNRLGIFSCLTLNPFILDFLIVSRGYSLALGLLMAAVALHCEELLHEQTSTDSTFRSKRLAVASLCLGLSFTASFSFAYIIVGVAASFLFAATPWRSVAAGRLWIAFFGPAAAAVLALSGSTVLAFPKSQLYFGAQSLRQMWHSLVVPSLSELNPQVVNPFLFDAFQLVGSVLPWAFFSLLALSIIAGLIIRCISDQQKKRRSLCTYLTCAVGGALVLCVVAHRSLRIPLPEGRTGIFFVPLSTLLIAIFIGFPESSKIGIAIRGGAMAILFVGSIYFVGCLRLSYFQEWKFEAETRPAFRAVQELARQRTIREVVTGWEYTGTFRFYELYYGRSPDVVLLEMSEHPHATRPIYVLHDGIDRDFLTQHQCDIAYRGEFSGIVAAVCSAE
jgi:hypothetical protein